MGQNGPFDWAEPNQLATLALVQLALLEGLLEMGEAHRPSNSATQKMGKTSIG